MGSIFVYILVFPILFLFLPFPLVGCLSHHYLLVCLLGRVFLRVYGVLFGLVWVLLFLAWLQALCVPGSGWLVFALSDSCGLDCRVACGVVAFFIDSFVAGVAFYLVGSMLVRFVFVALLYVCRHVI